MTIKLSSKSGGSLPRLAPDLTYPGDRLTSTIQFSSVTGIDASSGLTTLLNLSGKFYIDFLEIDSITAETNTCKLTVDGVVVWNDTYATGTSDYLLGSRGVSNTIAGSIQCDTSFLLEYQTQTDTSITFNYNARPIL